MLARIVRRCLAVGVAALLLVGVAVCPARSYGQEERKIKTKVQPTYPELAKRMNLTGTVKIQVVVAASGTAKNAKAVGGNPVLIEAALDAVKKWRWEAASADTTEVIEVHFVASSN